MLCHLKQATLKFTLTSAALFAPLSFLFVFFCHCFIFILIVHNNFTPFGNSNRGLIYLPHVV